MKRWASRYLSADDLWSVVGYGFIIVLTRVMNPLTELAIASLLASSMLAIFWLASQNVRTRNRERRPNARVLIWGLVAAASLLVSIGV